MEINYAKYVRPELVLEGLTDAAVRLAEILQTEASGVRDGSGVWEGSDVLGYALNELAPKVAELARLYCDATRPMPLKDGFGEESLPF